MHIGGEFDYPWDYLAARKTADGDLAGALSGAPDYFPVACDAIREMFRQTGRPVYDENGVMQRGVIVRHLVLPGNLDNTLGVLDWFSETFPKGDLLFWTTCFLEPHEVVRNIASRQITDKMDVFDIIVIILGLYILSRMWH